MVKHKARTAVICICGAAALSLGGMAVYSAFGSAPETAAAQHTVAVERMDIKQYVTVSGTVGSSNVSSVSSSAINTKVREVKVRVGDRVKKATLSPSLTIRTFRSSSQQRKNSWRILPQEMTST